LGAVLLQPGQKDSEEAPDAEFTFKVCLGWTWTRVMSDPVRQVGRVKSAAAQPAARGQRRRQHMRRRQRRSLTFPMRPPPPLPQSK